eukprot:1162039-Pelagomonas_calceolata.AAC.7
MTTLMSWPRELQRGRGVVDLIQPGSDLQAHASMLASGKLLSPLTSTTAQCSSRVLPARHLPALRRQQHACLLATKAAATDEAAPVDGGALAKYGGRLWSPGGWHGHPLRSLMSTHKFVANTASHLHLPAVYAATGSFALQTGIMTGTLFGLQQVTQAVSGECHVLGSCLGILKACPSAAN